MAAIISALDKHTPKQFGENGSTEYGWSNDLQEKILQFSFQLTRANEAIVQNLATVLTGLLTSLQNKVENSSSEKHLAKGYLSVLYRMIGHTRDIIDGKGEYTLTYMMIRTWYDFYPELAFFAVKCLVDLEDRNVHQYGSWKDIKYFCDYCKSQGDDVYHPLIQYAIQLLNEQLKKDVSAENKSLLSKWVPREKSSFSWLYESLACSYFPEYMSSAKSDSQQSKAVKKCKTQYRKLLSDLNRKIDTTQIKQCGHQWADINFDRVTSITLTKQKQAFLNVKKDRTVRFPDNEDRLACSENFKARIKKAAAGEVEMKGKRVGMADFTKQALELIGKKAQLLNSYSIAATSDEKATIQLEIDLLNSQWRDNSTQTGALGNMIAMVDVSGSMSGDPMHVAIALGLRIASKSALGKRVMTFSAKPTWVNLDGVNDFVSQVDVVRRADWGMNTNLHAAFDITLDSIVENKLSPEAVQDMIIVILSDMQIDEGDKCDKSALFETIGKKYAAAGIKVHNKPYKPPHLLFWNLRSTCGFPALSSSPNCSMMSGFSPALLNLFCEMGIDALQSCSPWSILQQTLENERYKIMAHKLDGHLQL
jgi:uncharacterized protein with von Willebrand factor type A (vWA) domain